MYAYLRDYRITSTNSKPYTHLSMGPDPNTRGKFHIPPKNHQKFLKRYHRHLEAGEALYLIESKTKIYRFFVDIDFPSQSQMPETLTYRKILECYQKAITESCILDQNDQTHAVLSTRLPHKIHINYPKLPVNDQISKVIRRLVIQQLSKEYSELSWESIIDESIYKANGLRMLGSIKKNETAGAGYRITNPDTSMSQSKVLLNEIKVTSLRIHAKNAKPVELKPHIKSSMKDLLVKRKKVNVKSAKKVNAQKQLAHRTTTHPIKPMSEEDQKYYLFLKDVIFELPAVYYENYSKWLETGAVLYNEAEGNIGFLKLWKEWSSQSGKYEPYACDRHWNQTFSKHSGDKKLIGSLIADLPEDKKKEIMSKHPDIMDRYRNQRQIEEGANFIDNHFTELSGGEITVVTDRSIEPLLYKNDNGETIYSYKVNVDSNPFGQNNSLSENLFGDITTNECYIRSVDPHYLGRKYPETGVSLPENVKNMLFVNKLVVVNNTYNTVQEQEDDPSELEYHEDEEHIKVFQDEEDNRTFLTSINGQHAAVANVVFLLYKDCMGHNGNTSSEKGWYQFVDGKWITGSDSLSYNLSHHAIKYYRKALKLYTNCTQISTDNKNQKIKRVNKLIDQLGNHGFKTGVLREASILFVRNNRKFESKLDANPTLVGFDNGVYDLDAGEFRQLQAQDYVTMTTGYDYVPLNKNSKTYKEIMKFLSQILPIPAVREYVLQTLGTYIDGSFSEEKFHIWTGSGGNGKSKLIELIEMAYGEYAGRMPVALITNKRQQSNQASSEIASNVKKRFCSFQEPNADEKINVGLMKELTGGDKITVRQLYGQQFEFKPQFKLVLCCNKIPEIPTDDEGTWRRIRVVEFISKFVKKPDPKIPYQFPRDINLPKKLFEWKAMFMSIMLDYHRKFQEGEFVEPDEVTQFTKDIQTENDPLKYFAGQYITQGEASDYIIGKELMLRYEAWYREYKGRDVPNKLKVKDKFAEILKTEYKRCIVPEGKCKVLKGWKLIEEEDDD